VAVPPASNDPSELFAAIIALLRPQAVVSKLVTGAGRWAVRYARYDDPGFCLMLEGGCFLDVDGLAPMALEQGDFVLLPEVPGFAMGSDRAVRPKPIDPQSTREYRHGTKSGTPEMRMLAGYFRFDRANASLLGKLLPPAVHVRGKDSGAARLRRIVELIIDEADMERAGRELILERLVEILLVEALRALPASAGSEKHGLLAGLADPALAAPLRRIHLDVARRWTVAELAREAGMSRAVFAERFTRRVGLPPMQYLLEWRMAIARDLLRRERPPLAEVAERVGYQSASAFSTAFTRVTGRSPSDFGRAPA
jgi:AraC-like DNA-binding protein